MPSESHLLSVRRNTLLSFQIIVGFGILALLLWRIDIQDLINVITSVHVQFLLPVILCYLASPFLATWRLQWVLKKFVEKISFRNVLEIHFAGLLAGDVSPGRSGYLITPLLLERKHRVALSSGATSVFAIQGLEFFVRLVFSILALIFFIHTVSLPDLVIGLALLGCLGVGTLSIFFGLTLFSSKQFRFLKKFDSIPLLGRISVKFQNSLPILQEKGKSIQRLAFPICLVTIIGMITRGLEWYFLGHALSIDLSLIECFFLVPLVTALSFIPVSIAGLGFQEAGAMGAMSLLGVSLESAVTFALLLRGMELLIDSVGISSYLSK